MTQSEWIEDQYMEHGFDYINELMDKGFEPAHTNAGWKWVLITSNKMPVVPARR